MINVGDRVVCVDTKDFEWDDAYQLPIEGKEYIVYEIREFCLCGPAFDVGLNDSPLPHDWEIYCERCGSSLIATNGIVWVDAWRFRKVEESRNYTVEKQEVKIEEPCLS